MTKLPRYYEFQHSTKIMCGQFALENIPTEFGGLACSKPLILSDGVLAKIGTLDTVLKAVKNSGINTENVYTEIPADSSLEVVNKIVGVYREKQCDGLLAVGGGSVIDTGKGVRMVLSQNVSQIQELEGCEMLSKGNYIPFIVVPTTSGTGSESTLVAVIKDTLRSVKMEYISYFLQPDAAVFDARMTQTLPPKMTASTGMDALCHAIEAFTCLQKNPVSDAYAILAMQLISGNIMEAVNNGKDEKVRLAMANGSTMAGAAFSNSMVGIVHAIGHALGGVCHVPHGDAMTILLPYCMEYNMDKLADLYAQVLEYITDKETYRKLLVEKGASDEALAKCAVEQIRRIQAVLKEKCGLATALREVGVDKGDFDRVAHTAINDGAMIVNPKAADIKDVIDILEKAW